MLCCCVVYGGEWMPAMEIRPTPSVFINYGEYLPTYYYAPRVIMIPAPVNYYYVPAYTYQNVVIEKHYWHLCKRYEIVPTAQTVYVPFRY